MWCDAQFGAFNNKIMLDATRRGRIESAVANFAMFCKSDPQLSVALAADPFLQGSVATRTAVKPLSSDEFDVDVIYPFSLSVFEPQYQNPASIIPWFASRLKESAFYARNLIPKNRCARIDYAGDFHVDFIPSTHQLPDHQPYGVPTRDLHDWKTNDPIGFANWVRARDERGGATDASGDGYFVRAVRMMKRWRDEFLDDDEAPSSMLLVTLLGNHDPSSKGYIPALTDPLFPLYQHDAAYLLDMLRLTHGCLLQPGCDAFLNPTIRSEDLARGWEKKHSGTFLDELSRCINNLTNGTIAERETESIRYYQKAFGDTFPSS